MRPWTLIAERVGIALGVPLVVLMLGWSLLWAFYKIQAKSPTARGSLIERGLKHCFRGSRFRSCLPHPWSALATY